jgi:AraC family transcriptional regulator
MDADIHTLYESDFYRILDFRCRCVECRVSKPEYSNAFCISFVRKGNFLFNVFRRSLDSYSGCVLVTKPGYERTVTHVHTIPDECTIFEFKNNFYEEIKEQYASQLFFTSNDIHSTLVRTNPELELLHHEAIQSIRRGGRGKLKMDSLVIELLEKIMPNITDYKPNHLIDKSLKKNHLVTIERAKEYLAQNFMRDLSLMELAAYSHVSSFHFSRIFKKFTSYSPHQFLMELRLKNAELFLKNTSMPVSDIGFTSGFNSAEHFTVAFRKKYGCSPSGFRSAVN